MRPHLSVVKGNSLALTISSACTILSTASHFPKFSQASPALSNHFNTLTKSRKNIPCSRLARSVITVHAQRILIRGYRIKTIRPSTRRKSPERRYG